MPRSIHCLLSDRQSCTRASSPLPMACDTEHYAAPPSSIGAAAPSRGPGKLSTFGKCQLSIWISDQLVGGIYGIRYLYTTCRAAFSDSERSIPMIDADFLHFTSKFVDLTQFTINLGSHDDQWTQSKLCCLCYLLNSR